MKIKKGEAGYLNAKTKEAIFRTIVEFAIVLIIFATGYFTTKTRLNILTVAAVLGCLPASRALVSVIMLVPRKSIEKEKAEEIAEKTSSLTTSYDMVLTSYEKIMPVECIVIHNQTVVGYSGNEKTDGNSVSASIKGRLSQNHYDKVSVKIFKDYHTFLARAEAMETLAQSDEKRNKEQEEKIKEIILSLSM